MSRKVVEEKTIYTFKELKEASEKGEVSKKAVERALEWMQTGATDHDWWDYTYEQYKSALEQIGFTDPDLSFTGFWSQGDGASFTSSVDIEALIDFLSNPVEATTVICLADGAKEDFRGWVVKQCGSVGFNPKYAKLKRVIDLLEMKVCRVYGAGNYFHSNTCHVEDSFRDTGEGKYVGNKYEWKSDQPRLRTLWDSFVETAEELRSDMSNALYKSLEEEHEYLTSDEALAAASEGNDWEFDEDGAYYVG